MYNLVIINSIAIVLFQKRQSIPIPILRVCKNLESLHQKHLKYKAVRQLD